MKDEVANAERERYFREAETWAHDRERDQRQRQRIAWIIASVATTIALCEAAALVAIAPLKTVVPYTLLVDRETGYVEALKPLERELISPDRALTRSFLAQYVIARESFAIDTLQSDYRKVALWSAGEARERYIAGMNGNNPASPLATLPRNAVINVQIRSISSLREGTALVRFTSHRADAGSQNRPQQTYAAVINYQFSGQAMSADDRLINPLGFQVTRYRRDVETVPDFESGQPANAFGAPAVTDPAANAPSSGARRAVPGTSSGPATTVNGAAR